MLLIYAAGARTSLHQHCFWSYLQPVGYPRDDEWSTQLVWYAHTQKKLASKLQPDSCYMPSKWLSAEGLGFKSVSREAVDAAGAAAATGGDESAPRRRRQKPQHRMEGQLLHLLCCSSFKYRRNIPQVTVNMSHFTPANHFCAPCVHRNANYFKLHKEETCWHFGYHGNFQPWKFILVLMVNCDLNNLCFGTTLRPIQTSQVYEHLF